MKDRTVKDHESFPPNQVNAPQPELATAARESPEHRSATAFIAVVPILVALVTFLFWYLTWFGRRLTDREMDQYLTDTSVPNKTQHALSQLAERIARGDVTVRRWHPQVLRLAENKESGLRLMAAWVMGQDNQSRQFHEALRRLLDDPEPMVRWNAALGLVRFRDAGAEPQLRLMLRPYTLLAPHAGKIRFRVRKEDAVAAGSLLARIEPDGGAKPVEVRSPLAGQVRRWLKADGAQVAAGDGIVSLSPGEEQVWETLRALFLVGQSNDLETVERFARGIPGVSDRVRRQAALTAMAIRQRTATGDK